ncbi:MAG: metallophosphoesterase [Opitutaceae bacterium]
MPAAPVTRRTFFTALAGAAVAARLAADETPFPECCRVRRLNVAGPAGWAGRRIVFLTDVHFGHHFGPPEAAALNTIVARERPDAVLLGGDLGDERNTPMDGFFAHWSPGCATVFAAGNHDTGYGGLSGVERQAKAHGVTVLRNERESWNGLTIVGVPSALCAPQRLDLVKGPGFKLLIGHEPDTWDWTYASDFMQLAGHTHGGQVRFLGRPICLPTLGRLHPLGLYERAENVRLLVSAGIGCTGPAVRVNCPPEIYRLDFT